jgi:hypothetical protein
MIGLEHLFLRKPKVRNGFDSASNLKTVQPKKKDAIKSDTMGNTYKGGTLGDIPATDVLIKGRGRLKHAHLTQEKWKTWLVQSTCCKKIFGSDHSINSNTSGMYLTPTWKQNHSSECIELNSIQLQSLVITYKAGTHGDIPVINGLIELCQICKQEREVCDTTDIPVIDIRPAIIVDAHAKGEPSLTSMICVSPYNQVKSFAHP